MPPRGELPAIIGQVAAIHAEMLARIVTRDEPVPVAEAPKATQIDRLLTIEEVAAQLGQTSRWVRRHWRELRARAEMPGRTLRFSEQRLSIFLKNRTRQEG